MGPTEQPRLTFPFTTVTQASFQTFMNPDLIPEAIAWLEHDGSPEAVSLIESFAQLPQYEEPVQESLARLKGLSAEMG